MQLNDDTVAMPSSRADEPGPGYHPHDPYRLARRTGLLHKIDLVRLNGWNSFGKHWAAVDVLGVCVALNDKGKLRELRESEATALTRWAYELFLTDEAKSDVENGLVHTSMWFAGVRTLAAL
jgi:hypothetical protein